MPVSTNLSVVSKHYVRRGRTYIFGPGKAEILQRIQETGSIAETAKTMKMSYMRAWQLVKSMNRGWREPLVLTTRGGAGRGGALLTPTGRAALDLYRELETEAGAVTEKIAGRFVPLRR